MAEFLCACVAVLTCSVAALVLAVRRQQAELMLLRKWRHDTVATHQVATGERLACLEMRVGLPRAGRPPEPAPCVPRNEGAVVMIALLLRWVLDARVASHVGAVLAGEPAFADDLACIAHRESRSTLIGVHPNDSWMQRSLGEGMSTRGVHGQVAAFALPSWLHGMPWLLDVPLFSAVVATRRARSWQCKAVPACVRWKGCGR